jgi:chemotaxis signal transduction protein
LQRGGVLLRVSDDGARSLVLVPADIVRSVVVLPSITPVEGLRAPAAGIALANGEVVTVLCLDEAGLRPSSRNERTSALLCDVGGRPVAITGRAIEAAGLFDEARPGAVRVGEALAEIVDVVEIYRSAESAIWAERGATLHEEEANR